MLYKGITLLPDATDLNSITETGVYDVHFPVNGPVDSHDYIVTVYKSPKSVPGDVESIQVSFDRGSGALSTRNLNGGSWGSWSAGAFTSANARDAIKTKTEIAALAANATANATVGADGTTAATLANSLKTSVNAIIAALKA